MGEPKQPRLDRFKEDVWEAQRALREGGFTVSYPIESTEEAEAFTVSWRDSGKPLVVRMTRSE